MRYLVTGAAGFIGSHLVDALDSAGHEVIGLDCFTDYYDRNLKEENTGGRDVWRLDLAADELDFSGFDGVFHLAGQPGVRSFGSAFHLYVRDNVLATQRVLEAATAARARVVLASSSSIYGEAECYPTPEDTEPRPISPYGITKLASEQLARAYRTSFGLDALVLRYFTVYGPRQRPDMFFARVTNALAGEGAFQLYGSGEQSRSFTFVGDAVAATIAAMDRAPAGALYNVGGGEEASMLEAISLLERIAGRELRLERTEAAAGDVRRTKAAIDRIREELDWSPQTGLEDGLRAHWEWALSRVGAR